MEALDVESVARSPLVVDMASMAAVVADAPMAAVCLVDGDRRWHLVAATVKLSSEGSKSGIVRWNSS